jgi:very-short-patch-repair endonuclease
MRIPRRKLEFARRMRKHPTRGEAALWEELRYFRYAKCRFVRQKTMCGFILDFYCPSRRLAVEVDGSSHYGREREDAIRQRAIEKRKKISFIRFTNAQVLHRLSWVLEQIGKACKMRRKLPRIKRRKRAFSTKSQRLSSSQGISSLKDPLVVKGFNRVGNVEKSVTPFVISRMPLQSCWKIVQNTVKDRESCQRQIYANMEVAENMARALRKIGIGATPYKCRICKLIHVREGLLESHQNSGTMAG